MLTELRAIVKLEEEAEKFRGCVFRKEWGEAHNIYNKAQDVAVFMEMGDEVLKRLFGDWDSDDGTGAAIDGGLFPRSEALKVQWKCCVERNQAYEDKALRSAGETPRYYSDPDYCARCEKNKKRNG